MNCTAFLLLVAQGNSQRSSPPIHLPPARLFDATGASAPSPAPVCWTNSSGNVAAYIWQPSAPVSSHQSLDLTAGRAIQVGDAYTGHFCQVQLDASGCGTLRQDPYGLHPLYFAHSSRISVLSNRPDLAARALEHLAGRIPTRDRCFAAWLALAGYPIGDRTGYDDVRSVPICSHIHIRPDHSVEFRSLPPPWLKHMADNPKDRISAVEHEMTANLRAVVATASHKPLLQLTGGRDSRLVLALAVGADLLHEVEVVTYGSPDTLDATIARELTRKLGIAHTQLPWHNSTLHSLCSHVDNVSGALNCADSNIAPSKDGRPSLSGFVGEALRSTWSKDFSGFEDEPSVVQGYLAAFMTGMRILRRDAHIDALSYGLDCMLSPAEDGARAPDLFDAFSLQHRIRRRISSRPDRFSREFFPLYHPPAVDVAFSMGWRSRLHGRIHHELIQKADPALASIDYGKPRGRYRVDTRAFEERLNPLQDRKRRTRPSLRRFLLGDTRTSRGLTTDIPRMEITTKVDKMYSREQTIPLRREYDKTKQSMTRWQKLYRELIHARENNPIFDEVIDRERLLEAIDHLPGLTHSGTLAVHGAMTGVIWLGRLEKEH